MIWETPDASLATAPPEALPPLFAAPPWRRRRGSGAPPVLALTPPEPESMVWAPGEREEWLSAPFELSGQDDVVATADRLRRGEPVDAREAAEFFAAGPEDLARPLLAGWSPESTPEWRSWMRRIISRFGTDALITVLRLAGRERVTSEGLLLPFRSAKITWRMESYLHEPDAAAAAHAWLDRHGEFAALTLLPRAFGDNDRVRRSAQLALLNLIATGHVEAVRAAGVSHGPEAADAVETLIGTEPWAVLPVKLPSIPRWFDPATLPPVRLRRPSTDSGAPVFVLPTASLRDLAMVFALHDSYQPYPGLAIVLQSCEPADLARFGWGLFEAWVAAGRNGRQGWVLDMLGLVGDDEVVRRLTPHIMAWPGENGHQRALSGLSVLERIGTEVALLQINHIAEMSRYDGLRSAARDRLGRLAARRGLTSDQLADRLVPDLGLDRDGSLTLDYGSRSFVVRFDEELQLCVADGDGRLLTSLPRPGARDDAEMAPAAYQRFTELKKDVRTVVTGQLSRLERAMVTGRRWAEAEFRDFLIGHPLLRHPARRLLWGRYDAKGALTGAFRVAEDGTFADVHDEVTTIAEGEVIGVVHPVQLGETLATWSEIFADYGIPQPFPQLGREIATVTEAEAPESKLIRFEGRQIPSRAVQGLVRKGWVHNAMEGRTVRSIVANLTDMLDMELIPGVDLSDVDLWPEQTLGPIWLERQFATLGDVDPVVFSEMIRDLEQATGSR